MAMLPLAESVASATASQVLKAQTAAIPAASAQHAAIMRLTIVRSFIVVPLLVRFSACPPTLHGQKSIAPYE